MAESLDINVDEINNIVHALIFTNLTQSMNVDARRLMVDALRMKRDAWRLTADVLSMERDA